MTLVNETECENYSVTFDGGSLSSGMYYYKMESGNFMDTKKKNDTYKIILQKEVKKCGIEN